MELPVWTLIIIGLLILTIIVLLYFFGRTYLYKLMNAAINYAEENFATNWQRLDGAIDWVVQRIPAIFRLFISRSWIQQAVLYC